MKHWILAIGTWLFSVIIALSQAQTVLDLPELNPQLDQFQRRIVAKATADQRPTIALFRQVRDAMAQGKPALAIDALEILAGRNRGQGEGGAQTWLRLALAWQAQSVSSPRGDPPGPAIAAAYGAYRRAQTDQDRIESLSLLGNMLMRLARIKSDADAPPDTDPADTGTTIENFELARRLAFQVFSKLAELAPGKYDMQKRSTEAMPFRLESVTYPPPPRPLASSYDDRCEGFGRRGPPGADPQVGNDELEPDKVRCLDNPAENTCLTFSTNFSVEPGAVAGTITVQQYNTGTGRLDLVAIPPVAVRSNSICYARLRYGTKYRFTVKDTLRGADGSQLVGPKSAVVDLPRRAASLGFRRGAYVLPSMGQRRIALKTVNLARAKLMLRRIGDRNLVREIVAKHIVGKAAPQDSCTLLSEVSENIAEGALEMAPGAQEDKEYALPVGEILQKRGEWLQTFGRGTDGKFTLVDDKQNRLALTPQGDQVAATSGAAAHAGVFILFGKTLDDERKPSADEPADATRCADGFSSQWFVITNIGLTLQRSPTKIYVLARALDTGAPVKDMAIEFISKNGTRLKSQTTNQDGVAEIPARLGRGTGGNALAAIMANRALDFAFLDMTTDAIDLTDRGLDGASKVGDYDAFIAPSRGIFRPGEWLETLVLVRGPDGRAPANLPPVELTLTTSGGATLKKQEFGSADTNRAGGFLFKTFIPKSTAEGTLTLTASILGSKVGSETVRVEYYKPLSVRVTSEKGALTANVNERNQLLLKGTARADYLYGMAPATAGATGSGTDAPAGKLRGELQVRLEPAQSPIPGCFEGFTFGLKPEEAKSQIFRGPSLQSDDNGQIAIDFPQDGVQPTEIPMRASLTMTLLDFSGRVAEGKFEVPVTRSGRRWLGVRTVPPSRPNAPMKFEYVLLDDKNQPVGEQVWATTFREQTDFVWSQDATTWVYTPVPPHRQQVGDKVAPRVTPASGTGGSDCPAASSFELPFPDAGRYLVRLTDNKGESPTELTVGAGWTTSPDGNIKPDALRVWTQDQKSFGRGERVDVTVETPHEAGQVFVEVIVNGEIRHAFEAAIERAPNVKTGTAKGSFTVGDWPAGAMHIYATSFRRAGSDDSFEGGPGRAIGGLATQIGANAQRPTVAINPRANRFFTWELHDGKPLQIPVSAQGLSPNAYVTVAVVDEGIRLLTPDFRTPDPYDHFFKRRGLNLDVFDNYGRVLYGRMGGDQTLAPLRGAGYQPDDIVIWHSPIVRMANNQAVIEISPMDLEEHFPATYQGELRVMVWAWDETSAAQSDTQITVRDPVVVRLSKPAFMAPGDIGVLPLRAHNPGNARITAVTVNVNLSGGVAFADNRPGATPGQACEGGGSPTCRSFTLPARMREAQSLAQIPIQALSDATAGEIKLSYRLDDMPVTKTWTVPVRAPHPNTVAVVTRPEIARGATLNIGRADLETIARQQNFDVNSLRLAVRISRNDLMSPPVPGEVAEAEIQQLEQLTSLLQLILLSDAPRPDGGTPGVTDQTALVERVNRLIGEIGALQNVEGDFRNAPIPGATNTGKLDSGPNDARPAAAAFVLDVFSRAKLAGGNVDNAVIDKAATYLSGVMRSIGQSDKCSRSDVYVLTVLARLNRIGPAPFRNVSDVCAKTAGTDATKKLLLASAYASFGLNEQAQVQLASAGIANLNALAESPAEATRVGALLLESGLAQVDPAVVLTKVGLKAPDRSDNLVTSSWLARTFSAALTILDKRQRAFTADSVAVTPTDLIARSNREGMELKPVEYTAFPAGGIRVVNRAETALQLSYVIDGVPLKMQADYSEGLSIRLNRLGAEAGKELQFKQFQTAYYTVEINQTDGYAGAQRLAAVQVLPTGFEGVETSYQDTWGTVVGDVINKKALSDPEYAEFQTDRWIALPRPAERRATHLLAFSVRATFPGEYVLPPLLVRDLDNPKRIAWTRPVKIVVTPAE